MFGSAFNKNSNNPGTTVLVHCGGIFTTGANGSSAGPSLPSFPNYSNTTGPGHTAFIAWDEDGAQMSMVGVPAQFQLIGCSPDGALTGALIEDLEGGVLQATVRPTKYDPRSGRAEYGTSATYSSSNAYTYVFPWVGSDGTYANATITQTLFNGVSISGGEFANAVEGFHAPTPEDPYWRFYSNNGGQSGNIRVRTFTFDGTTTTYVSGETIGSGTFGGNGVNRFFIAHSRTHRLEVNAWSNGAGTAFATYARHVNLSTGASTVGTVALTGVRGVFCIGSQFYVCDQSNTYAIDGATRALSSSGSVVVPVTTNPSNGTAEFFRSVVLRT